MQIVKGSLVYEAEVDQRKDVSTRKQQCLGLQGWHFAFVWWQCQRRRKHLKRWNPNIYLLFPWLIGHSQICLWTVRGLEWFCSFLHLQGVQIYHIEMIGSGRDTLESAQKTWSLNQVVQRVYKLSTIIESVFKTTCFEINCVDKKHVLWFE